MRRFLILFLIFQSAYLYSQEFSAELLSNIQSNVTEVSGIVSTIDHRIFVIGDSGNSPSVYETNKQGEILNTILISNATNVDWEELQLDSNGSLYIGDIGNNLSQRQDLVIYKIPNFTDSLHRTEIDYSQQIYFSYQDQTSFNPESTGEFDSEAFLVIDETIHLFSKDHGSSPLTKTYLFSAEPGTQTAILTSQISNNRWLTGVTFNFFSDEIYFTSLDGVRVFCNYSLTGLALENCEINLTLFLDKQIESLSLLSSGEFLVAEDGENGVDSKLYSAFISCEHEPSVQTFPIPFDSNLEIRSDYVFFYIKIFTTQGQLLREELFSNGLKNTSIILDDLSSGIFILEVGGGSFRVVKNIRKD